MVAVGGGLADPPSLSAEVGLPGPIARLLFAPDGPLRDGPRLSARTRRAGRGSASAMRCRSAAAVARSSVRPFDALLQRC